MAYYRLDQLVDMLAVFSPTDQNYLDKMRKLINVDVLIIDDFMTISINQRGQEDLTKIINLDAHFDLRRADQATSGTPFKQSADLSDDFDYTVLGISRPKLQQHPCLQWQAVWTDTS